MRRPIKSSSHEVNKVTTSWSQQGHHLMKSTRSPPHEVNKVTTSWSQQSNHFIKSTYQLMQTISWSSQQSHLMKSSPMRSSNQTPCKILNSESQQLMNQSCQLTSTNHQLSSQHLMKSTVTNSWSQQSLQLTKSSSCEVMHRCCGNWQLPFYPRPPPSAKQRANNSDAGNFFRAFFQSYQILQSLKFVGFSWQHLKGNSTVTKNTTNFNFSKCFVAVFRKGIPLSGYTTTLTKCDKV